MCSFNTIQPSSLANVFRKMTFDDVIALIGKIQLDADKIVR